jgi:hypothetical protein
MNALSIGTQSNGFRQVMSGLLTERSLESIMHDWAEIKKFGNA